MPDRVEACGVAQTGQGFGKLVAGLRQAAGHHDYINNCLTNEGMTHAACCTRTPPRTLMAGCGSARRSTSITTTLPLLLPPTLLLLPVLLAPTLLLLPPTLLLLLPVLLAPTLLLLLPALLPAAPVVKLTLVVAAAAGGAEAAAAVAPPLAAVAVVAAVAAVAAGTHSRVALDPAGPRMSARACSRPSSSTRVPSVLCAGGGLHS